ncbi:MAG: hypothetical protein F6K30_12155 [Cyanothece sp. SIO2G6]|nr:hypothetical protein [Cyanothece sp. SIO2G6]
MEYQDPSIHESSNNALSVEVLSIHDQLARLMETAQQYPFGSIPRNQAITAMYRLIHQSGKISRKWCQFSRYEEAINDTWADFVRKLDQYDCTQASVLTWFNRLLNWKCGDWYRKRDRPTAPQPNDESSAPTTIEQIAGTADGRIILNHFQRWLQDTPELKTTHLQNRSDITAYRVIHHRILDHQYPGWRDLAHFFRVEVRSLQNFWDRKCKLLLQQFCDQLEGML